MTRMILKNTTHLNVFNQLVPEKSNISITTDLQC